ncbi:hypothetical protein POM88_036905 [Heracleum sosnowskyi]|uniref:Uncharacterized protein n=1 Tax=Heracleum sosnowskyi TaxID=360622 RepID=A0AAD8HQY5_9APIA|nr:hypothetical protein POM88_036905 [Heracleum sosnowskyi]
MLLLSGILEPNKDGGQEGPHLRFLNFGTVFYNVNGLILLKHKLLEVDLPQWVEFKVTIEFCKGLVSWCWTVRDLAGLSCWFEEGPILFSDVCATAVIVDVKLLLKLRKRPKPQFGGL